MPLFDQTNVSVTPRTADGNYLHLSMPYPSDLRLLCSLHQIDNRKHESDQN
jgi:hypothetical protein